MQSVGWLGRQLGAQDGTGVVDPSVLPILADRARTPRSRTMGVHDCELRPGDGAERADGEIHVYGEDGSSCSSPTMIVHYVEAHGFVPPEEFLKALGRPRAVRAAGGGQPYARADRRDP